MRVHVYVLKHDSGFAPNPFHGWCTLACCKPAIRRCAERGDWVVGVTPAADGNRLAYAMKVDETPSFAEYWRDSRFRAKRPAWTKSASRRQKNGDNCYRPLGNNRFQQLRSVHFDRANDREDVKAKTRDLRGKRVLVGRRFCYYGVNAQKWPSHLTFRRPARFNRVIFREPELSALLRHLDRLPQGIHGRPRDWRRGDACRREGRARCD
jgi:hypothetical protein